MEDLGCRNPTAGNGSEAHPVEARSLAPTAQGREPDACHLTLKGCHRPEIAGNGVKEVVASKNAAKPPALSWYRLVSPTQERRFHGQQLGPQPFLHGFRRTWKRPVWNFRPQQWVKPRKSNVSGLPC